MKAMNLLAWFLFIFCTHALSSLALTSFFNFEHEGANLSMPIVRGQEIHGVDGTDKLCGEKHEMDDSRKHQRGKGGVSNVAHRPTERSTAPPLLARPQQPYLITKTMLQLTFAFILLLPFQVL